MLRKFFYIMLLFCALPQSMHALCDIDTIYPMPGDTLLMPSTRADSTCVILSPGAGYTILDPGGVGNYPPNMDFTVLRLVPPPGYRIRLNGAVCFEDDGYDHLTIFYSPGGDPVDLGTSMTIDYEFPIDSYVTLRLYTNTSRSACYGLEAVGCLYDIDNIEVSEIRNGVVEMSWEDVSDATEWTVHLHTIDNDSSWTYTVHETRAVFHNLPVHTTCIYYITNNTNTTDTAWCNAPTRLFTTPCQSVPWNYDVNYWPPCDVVPMYGSVFARDPVLEGATSNRDLNTGFVDYGPDSQQSRHTHHHHPEAVDERASRMLHPVQPGCAMSVRLGNGLSGGGQESLRYYFRADTSVYDLLLVDYAVVLQDPQHDMIQQPRFSLLLLDSVGDMISNVCYNTDLVPSATSGWVFDEPHFTRWLDWSTIGIDLAALNGQRVCLRFETHDCTLGSHYGYAYINSRGMRKIITSTTCGNDLTGTFTAPDGFTYEWFNINAPNQILARTQSFTPGQLGVFQCRASFRDNCSFTMYAFNIGRFPVASATVQTVDSTECSKIVQFHNHSYITTDAAGTDVTPQLCDAAFWDFGDGDTSNAFSPVHIYGPGSYNATLVAFAGGQQCSDTMHFLISNDSPVREQVIDTALCDGMALRMGAFQFTEAGSYTEQVVALDGCDSILMVNLTYIPIDHTSSSLTINHGDSARFGNRYYYESGTYSDTVKNRWGCDSVATLVLQVNPVDPLDPPDPPLPPLDPDTIRLDSSDLWIPNVFTPDEKANSVFSVKGNDIFDIEVTIFNREGLFVTEFHSIDGYWDGTYQGKKCPEAAYVYFITYHTKTDLKTMRTCKGTVLLLR